MHIKAFLDLTFIFSIIFVGNFYLGSVPLFFIIWVCLVIYRLTFSYPFSAQELKIQFVFLLFTLPLLIKGILASDYYYFFLFQLVLSINILPLVFRNLSNKYIALQMFFLIFFIYLGLNSNVDSRGQFIFGPNMIYRILGFLFVYVMVIKFSLIKSRHNILIVILSYVFFFLGLVATGSRGATLILIICTIPFLAYMRKTGLFKYVMIVFLIFIASFIWVYFDIVSSFMGRLLFFDLNNSSEATRVSMYEKLFYFLKYESSFNLLAGLGNMNYLYPEKGYYPHNLIIELIVYHGLLYLFIIMFFLIYGIYCYVFKQEVSKVLSIFIPISIGTMLSGDLTDNYTVFLFIPVLFFSSTTSELLDER